MPLPGREVPGGGPTNGTGGGCFLWARYLLPLYGTDPSEMRCLFLQGYLACVQGYLAHKKTPTPLGTP